MSEAMNWDVAVPEIVLAVVETRVPLVPMAPPAVRLRVPAVIRVALLPSSSTLPAEDPSASVALPALTKPAVRVPVLVMLEEPRVLSAFSASAPVLLT
jgi:hypothetical protein